jgi:hypothetical protein
VDLDQEWHQALNYTGTWNLRAARGASGGYINYANTPGAMARFSFAGRNVAWIALTGPNRGKAEVRGGRRQGQNRGSVFLERPATQDGLYQVLGFLAKPYLRDKGLWQEEPFLHGQAGWRGHLCIVALGKE